MEVKLKLRKIMYLCFAISFFVSAVVSCGICMTAILVFVWPFNKKMYRKLTSYLGYTMFAQAVFMLRWWATTDLKLYVDKEVYMKYLGKEHSLCILNHSGELDWIIVSSLLDKFNILGNVKAYMKNAVKFIPFVGWGFYCCEFIYLSRSYEKDKIILEKSARNLSEYEDPISILLFPEGTRFSPKKHEAALKFSRERGLRELKHHLVPRTKGFTTSVPYMRGKIPAVYDIEIAFDGVKPTITNMIKARRFIVHMYIRRIPMEEIPETEKDQEVYLHDMFYRKDKLIDSFRNTGDFFKESGIERYEPITMEPHINSLYNSIFWFIFSLSPIIYFLIKLFLNGQFLYICLFVAAIGFSFNVLNKSVDNMEVKDTKVKNNNMEVKAKAK
ncbi:PREDICTED: 1-acyl-sn-glycerol-3-phosphate acyltransferase delta-like [Nicrophorus vespilloides]|uniref:1-acyl-sn-glycerol-3-phosphate acyltransferase delta-like n=1 Tax=Nicrophorus vespilloides TaxID=110193 RepID=A0ABM1NCT2_NICVS|nr:PREDICTED: 1-acyl-sn-glycerol-3-phosphate acyltransferase delta-like [Nicrophorus vespilloides]XP_017784633.1 PREDICTED: 1-acyl-sn-glycerol-3-phosphate acyltransferase delta-like [Nicrophorus vespilloides]XP_017784634.1 PREDICTED: 1-acyl-sn-glycerol-3-phosphate acyltransferase delta-like [Nicrophorus vespilloides]